MGILLFRFISIPAVFCLALLHVGCTRVEDAIVTQHFGDQGMDKIPINRNSTTVDVGLSISPLPQGSIFVYDNPVERWQATAVDQQNITWRNNNGDTKLTALSSILPALRWDGEQTSGRRNITSVSGSLHPLKKGNKISFYEDVINTRPPGAYSGFWECEVQDQVAVTVPAGTFATWQILCKLNGREHILINYNEQLGNNVRTLRVSENNQPITRQLIASSLLPHDTKPAEPEKAQQSK
jgi:hypothetical protein